MFLIMVLQTHTMSPCTCGDVEVCVLCIGMCHIILQPYRYIRSARSTVGVYTYR